jgi:hypothetical protein
MLLLGLIVVCIVAIFALPISCGAGLTMLITDCFCRRIYQSKPLLFCLYGLITFPIGFCFGMALNIIAIPLAIIIGLPVLLYIYLSERRKVHRDAD